MCKTKRKKPTGQERPKLAKAFRMLSYATDLDLTEIDHLNKNVKDTSQELTTLEKKYNIKNYKESRNPQKYPENERAKVIYLWNALTKRSEELDYLFIDEDLYVC